MRCEPDGAGLGPVQGPVHVLVHRDGEFLARRDGEVEVDPFLAGSETEFPITQAFQCAPESQQLIALNSKSAQGDDDTFSIFTFFLDKLEFHSLLQLPKLVALRLFVSLTHTDSR